MAESIAIVAFGVLVYFIYKAVKKSRAKPNVQK